KGSRIRRAVPSSRDSCRRGNTRGWPASPTYAPGASGRPCRGSERTKGYPLGWPAAGRGVGLPALEELRVQAILTLQDEGRDQGVPVLPHAHLTRRGPEVAVDVGAPVFPRLVVLHEGAAGLVRQFDGVAVRVLDTLPVRQQGCCRLGEQE